VSAFNVVRFRVRAGCEQEFIDAHRNMRPQFKGLVQANLVRTGDQTFCVVGEWRDFASLAAARPEMIGLLDGFRHLLEDLGGGLGVTDPVSGESVVSLWAQEIPKQAGKTKAKKAQSKAKAKSKAKPKAKSKTKKGKTKKSRKKK
jgi:heme-degrading monooxygenase HmoA